MLFFVKQEGQDGPVSLTSLLDKFESVGLLVQEKKFNIDFQDGGHHVMILATFDLQWSSSQLPFWFDRNVQNRLSTWLLG